MSDRDHLQDFRHKKDQNKSQLHVSDLNQVKRLIYEGELNEALTKVGVLQRKNEIDIKEKLVNQIYKSSIIIQMGDALGGLSLVEYVIEESQQIGNLLTLFDANVVKASALFELGELNTSLEVVKTAENILGVTGITEQPEYDIRASRLKILRGKIYRKKGDLTLALGYLHEAFFIMQEYGSQYEKADLLNILGIVHASRSENDSALDFLKKSLAIFEEFGNRSYIIKITNNIGMIYWLKGEHDHAMKYYQKCLILSEEEGNKRYNAVLLSNIAMIYRHRGDFNFALDYFTRGLKIYEELKSKSELATFYNNIGGLYEVKGELDEALDYYQKSLAIAEELGDKQEFATSFNHIGNIYYFRGEIERAIGYYEKSLKLFEEVGNNINTCRLLFLLIKEQERSGKKAHDYLQKLQQINSKEENKVINQVYRLSKAIVLRTDDRLASMAEAQQLFQEIAQEEEILNIEYTVVSILYLCESLLLELRTTGDEEIISEVKALLAQSREIVEKQYSYPWLAQIFWLESKLALLELDIKRSQRLLSKAISLAEEKGLRKLAEQITKEQELFTKQISQWERILELKPSPKEVIELTQLEDLLELMINKKLYRKEDEVIEYAAKARDLLKKWGEIE